MKRLTVIGNTAVYDKQSEESGRRSDTGCAHRRRYQLRLFACDLCHNLHQHRHVTCGRAGNCPRHQRDCRA